MKPSGPIPPYFSASDDGQLMIGGLPAEELVAEAGGTPLFAYDNNIVGAQVANSAMEKREHPVGLKRHDVDADVQLALKGQEWQKPAGLNLLARIAIHYERCVMSAP